jgi:hypothetical protein
MEVTASRMIIQIASFIEIRKFQIRVATGFVCFRSMVAEAGTRSVRTSDAVFIRTPSTGEAFIFYVAQRCTHRFLRGPAVRKRGRAGSANRRSKQREGGCFVQDGRLRGCEALKMIVSKNRNGIVPDERGKTGRAKHAQVVSRILS